MLRIHDADDLLFPSLATGGADRTSLPEQLADRTTVIVCTARDIMQFDAGVSPERRRRDNVPWRT